MTSDNARERQLQADSAGDPNSGDGGQLGQVLAGDAEGTEFVIGEPAPSSRAPMLLLVLLVVLGAVIYLVYLKKAPQAATASPGTQTQAAKKTINQFLSSGNDSIKQMEQLKDNIGKVVQEFRSYPAMAQVPLSQLKDNPFRHVGSDDQPGAGDTDQSFERLAAERQRILDAVRQLQLQSIMHGENNRACMINNTMYTEGQQIDQFTIDRIMSSSVVVRSGQYRFELKMVH